MANYEHTTRTEFRDKVQQKLGEFGVHWSDEEINLSINEALLTFGAISGFWKEEVFINTIENKVIYNLFEDVAVGNAFIEPTMQYKDIFDWLNRDLLESISFAFPASEFLSSDTYIKAVQTKYNQFQQATNLILLQEEHEIPANQNVIQLPATLIDIIRVSFTTQDLEEIVLDEADEQEISLNADETEVGDPLFYSTVYGMTKDLKIYPIPANVGRIKILYISGLNENVPAENIIINLPNNLIPYLRFGVEADIFNKEGLLHDPVRAAYCKQRWEEGILIGRNYTSALIAKINEKNIELDSMNNVDLYSDDIKVRTPPTVLGFGGFNVFRTDVIPSDVEYSIGILLNANAKLPADDDDFIRVDLEYIDTLADYVVHLAVFRNGASEVATTNNLKDNFLRVSVNHNRRLLQAGITFDNLIGATKKQEIEQPRIPVEQ